MNNNEIILDGSSMCFKEIFSKYVTHSTAKGIDNINFEKYKLRIDENSELISKKLKNNNYKFSCYNEKLILKGRKKEPRIISIPTIRDKVILKYMQLVLKNNCIDINQKIPQFHIDKFKNNITNYNYLIKVDIEKFYDKIEHDILIDKLKKFKVEERIIELIKKAISRPTINNYELYNSKVKKEKNKRGVPQGLSISNLLAEIYIKEVDDLFSKKTNLKYIRYVDDIVILCNEKDAGLLYSEIEGLLKNKLNLKINEKKYTHKIDDNIDVSFLGYNYTRIYNKFNGFTIKKENLFKFENSIVNMFIRFESDKNVSQEQFIFKLNNKITGSISKKIDTDITRESKYGWLFFYSQIDDYTILYNLDKLIDKLIQRFERCKCIERNEIKSFIRTFEEIRTNIRDTTYIHRPDNLDIEGKRELLINTFKIDKKHLETDVQIERLYYRFVYKDIKQSQRDIQQMIS